MRADEGMMVLKVAFSYTFRILLLLQQLGNLGLWDWLTDGLSLLEGVAGLWKGGGQQEHSLTDGLSLLEGVAGLWKGGGQQEHSLTDGLSLLDGVDGLWKGGVRDSRQQRRGIDLPMVCLFWRELLVSGREEASRDV
jgi:hypothetical protein